MNWLKKLWNWLVRKTSTAPKLAVVEEEPTPVEVEEEDSAGDLFDLVIRASCLKPKDFAEQKAAFLEHYTGDADESSIRAAMRSVCETDEYMRYLLIERNRCKKL